MSWPVRSRMFPPPLSCSDRLPPLRDVFGDMPDPTRSQHTQNNNVDHPFSEAALRAARAHLHSPPFSPLGQHCGPLPTSPTHVERVPGCSSAPATPHVNRRYLGDSIDLPSSSPSTSTCSYAPSGRLPMSASFAHSKLNALPAVDLELDRLARACGLAPTSLSFLPSRAHQEPGEHEQPWAESSRAPRRSALHERGESGSTSASWDCPPDLCAPSAAWALRPRARSVRVTPRQSSPFALSRPRSTSQPASIPVFAPTSPHGVLRSLRDVLDRDGVQLDDCLDVQHVVERWSVLQRGNSKLGLDPSDGAGGHQKTFGAPVSIAVRCASMFTVLGGYRHEVPWVVYACVEELNRTGIYQPGLFRAVPHRKRLEKLIADFDLRLPSAASSRNPLDAFCPPVAPTPSVTRASLRKESMADICALLKTYLDLLPEPLLDETLTAALHRLCVEPGLLRGHDEVHAAAGEPCPSPKPDPRTVSLHCPAPSYAWCASPLTPSRPQIALPKTPSRNQRVAQSLDATQAAVAQHLLRLVPPPRCALLAYLLAFFTQLPLCPDNGMTFEDVARMFGRALAGGSVGEREAVLLWLLEHWACLSDGLFDLGSGEGADSVDDVDSSPPMAFSSTFSPSPPVSPPSASASPETTPKLGWAMEGVESEEGAREKGPFVGMLQIQAPMFYSRPHSTSISSDGAESVASVSTGESEEPSPGVCTPGGAEGGFGAGDAACAVREHEMDWESEAAGMHAHHPDSVWSGREVPEESMHEPMYEHAKSSTMLDGYGADWYSHYTPRKGLLKARLGTRRPSSIRSGSRSPQLSAFELHAVDAGHHQYGRPGHSKDMYSRTSANRDAADVTPPYRPCAGAF